MSGAVAPAVVVDTMVVSSIVHGTREPGIAASYRSLIGNRPVVVSFVTVTELRYGALKAGWGDLRRRGLERDLAQLVGQLKGGNRPGVAGVHGDHYGWQRQLMTADEWAARTAYLGDYDYLAPPIE